MNITGLDAANVQKLWPSLKPFFESFASCSAGRDSVETLRRNVIERDMQCWIAQEDGRIYACALTEVVLTPTGQRWAHLGYLTGRERKRWTHLAGEFKAKAKEAGMDGVTIHARKGWTRFLESQGLRNSHAIFEAKF
jgi:hypothetical protein